MTADWTQTAQGVGAIGGLVITFVGFAFVFHQIRQIERSIRSDTYSKIFSQAFEVAKLLAERPALRPYFYDNVDPPLGSSDIGELNAIAEIVADLLEHITYQRNNLPRESWVKWVNFIQSMYRTSPVLRSFLERNSSWYIQEFRDLLPTVPTSEERSNCELHPTAI